MRIVGLDPGLRRTGWGVVEAEGNRLRHVAHGIVATDARATTAGRLAQIFRGVDAVFEAHAPEQAAVEEVFVNKNAGSTLKLGQARGVALLVPAMRGVAVAEYAANLVKKSIVGAGHAEKNQVIHMVRLLLPSAGAVEPDAADALAVAICHVHHAGTRRLWAVEAGARRGAVP
ncbi:MAG: crossover junction endodeoxyribonuclease RuvC [Rhodospirillaceae bacterium]|nr:crossover junction endodeoxyribonuclease RuvC [Rhodospirillaceae bacterium]